MINLDWFFILIYVVLVVASVVTVLMDNRQPSRTAAWVLVLLFVPIVGFVLYFFFGQNTRKMKIISKHSLDQLTERSMLGFVEQKGLTLPDEHSALIRQFAKQCNSMPFRDNDVQTFVDGRSLFLSMLREIASARHHVHVDVYIIADDALGRLFADALIDRARHGVEVRLIYDDVGCWHVKSAFFERMSRAGVDVKPFMRVKFPAFTSKVNYRNHRKLCVIDGMTAFIGGMNIALRYAKGTDDGRSWRDTHVMLRGAAVYAAQSAFLVDWYSVSRTLINDRVYYPEPRSYVPGVLAQIVTSSPLAKYPDMMQGYVRLLVEAKRYIYIQTPYFLPTEQVLSALQAAALSGVDVRLMVPLRGDSRLARWAATSYLNVAAEAGISVLLYRPGFLHSKTVTCDDTLFVCGSTNIDFRSFENNFEADVFLYDKAIATTMRDAFLADAKQCIPLEEMVRRVRRPFLRRLWESLVRLVAPLL